MSRFRRSFVEPERVELLQAVNRAAGILELRQAPRLVSSYAAPTPMVVGLWRPLIVIPSNLYDEVSAEQLDALLLHETAHVAHRDQWVGLLQRLIGMLFWPLPLVHMVNRRLSALREEICDNYVVRAYGTGRELAEVLVQLAERLAISPTLPATIGLLESAEDGLSARIERLLQKERNTMTRINIGGLLAMCAFSVGVCGAIMAANVRAADESKPSSPPTSGQKNAKPETPRNDARPGTMWLEIRWAEAKQTEGLTENQGLDLSCSEEKVYLHKEAILTHRDIAASRPYARH